MAIDRLIGLLAMVALLRMMVTTGLEATPRDILEVARDWRMVLRAVVANYVVVPAAAVGLLLWLNARPVVAAGILIAGVCPAAPYSARLTALAGGNVVLAVGLMVILAGSSAILAPLLLRGLLPIVARGTPLEVHEGRIVSTLLVSQLLPLCAGLYIRARRPALADRLAGLLVPLGRWLGPLLIGLILIVQCRMLAQIRLAGYAGMLTLALAALAAGWLLGGSNACDRRTLAITTPARNIGVSLVVATASFAGTPAVTAATAYAVFQTILMALVALAWGRLASLRPAVAKQAS